MSHSVEKIGGTSMSDYAAVRDNIILAGAEGDPCTAEFLLCLPTVV